MAEIYTVNFYDGLKHRFVLNFDAHLRYKYVS